MSLGWVYVDSYNPAFSQCVISLQHIHITLDLVGMQITGRDPRPNESEVESSRWFPSRLRLCTTAII